MDRSTHRSPHSFHRRWRRCGGSTTTWSRTRCRSPRSATALSKSWRPPRRTTTRPSSRAWRCVGGGGRDLNQNQIYRCQHTHTQYNTSAMHAKSTQHDPPLPTPTTPTHMTTPPGGEGRERRGPARVGAGREGGERQRLLLRAAPPHLHHRLRRRQGACVHTSVAAHSCPVWAPFMCIPYHTDVRITHKHSPPSTHTCTPT